jgi:Flp pilus assembly CpaF family ATPase
VAEAPASEYFDWGFEFAREQPRRLSDAQREFVRRHLQERLPPQVLDYFGAAPDRMERIETAIREALSRPGFPRSPEYPLPPAITPDFVAEVYDDVVGLGPLEALLRDSTVTSINVVAWDTIYVERGREREQHPETFRDQAHLRQVAESLAVLLGHALSRTQPRMTDFVEAGGVRARVHIDTTSVTGPYIGFRRGRGMAWPLSELVRRGAMPGDVAEMLCRLARAEVPMLIVGPPGSGKTTVLEALLRELPVRHLVVIEDGVNELSTEHPYLTHVVIEPVADAAGAGRTAGDMAEAAKSALRKNCDQVVYGEILDGNAGHVISNASSFRFSATTLHGHTIEAALARLAILAQLDNTVPRSPYVGLDEKLVRADIALAFRAVVLCGRLVDGRQVVREIAWTDGLGEKGEFRLRRLAWLEETAAGATWHVDEGFVFPELYALSLRAADLDAARAGRVSIVDSEPYRLAVAAVRSGAWTLALHHLLEAVHAAAGPGGPSARELPLDVRNLLLAVLARSGALSHLAGQAQAAREALDALCAARRWADLDQALLALDHDVPLAALADERGQVRELRRRVQAGREQDAHVAALLETAQRVAASGHAQDALVALLGAPLDGMEAEHYRALHRAAQALYAQAQDKLGHFERARAEAQIGALGQKAGLPDYAQVSLGRDATQVVEGEATRTVAALAQIVGGSA